MRHGCIFVGGGMPKQVEHQRQADRLVVLPYRGVDTGLQWLWR